MFRFDLSTLNDRDLWDTIQALYLILTSVAGQHDNILLQYLLRLMNDEFERRESFGTDIGTETVIVLPLNEATNAHVWMLLKFAGGVVTVGSKGRPTAMTQFFAAVILEIEQSAQRLASAANN
jgi:hypothetical protein